MDPCAAEAQAVIDAYAADAIAEANLAIALTNFAACRLVNPGGDSPVGMDHPPDPQTFKVVAKDTSRCPNCGSCPTCGK